MTPELRLRAKTIEPAVIGSRLREARLRQGLTQSQLAEGATSTAYVSRVEAGNRRASIDVLVALAKRLEVTLDDLLAATPEITAHEQESRLRLELDYAELAFQTGSVDQALVGADSVLADEAVTDGLRRQAQYLRGVALEAQGRLEPAIAALEPLIAAETPDREAGLSWMRTVLALVRCYRESGDLALACDLGARAAQRIAGLGLDGTDEAVRLAVTVAMAHAFRGDVNHALRICNDALEVAQRLDSPAALAAAYWNSSLFESELGHIETAIDLAERGIAAMQKTEDARNLARLRSLVADLLLRVQPPRTVESIQLANDALHGLGHTSAKASEIAEMRLVLARGHMLAGDFADAEAIVAGALADEAAARNRSHVVALVLKGQLAAARGQVDLAVQSFTQSVQIANALGADRDVAQAWFELGHLLRGQGRSEEALEAYERAAASSGLVVTPVVAPSSTYRSPA